MRKEQFNLMSFFEGYVRNYRRLNLNQQVNQSMFTKREVDYWVNLGESLGLFSFVEDSKPDKKTKRSRPMDLSWWKWDARKDSVYYRCLVLHLERENWFSKDMVTLDKLFLKTEDTYTPQYVVGILNIETKERIKKLNQVVQKRNSMQGSKVLMIYRYHDREKSLDRIEAYHFSTTKLLECRKAISSVDDSGYWFMAFEEEYQEGKR